MGIKMKKTFLLACLSGLLLLAASARAQTTLPAPEKQKFHFNKAAEDDAGYAQAVRVGNTLYVSGVAGGGDMASALRRVYSGLERNLAAYGLTFKHVVKETLYTTDIEAVKKNNEVRKPFYQSDFPAATWVQISRLYMPEATLEVEVIAVIPDASVAGGKR